MSSRVVLIPGAPVLVPELAGAAAVETSAQVDALCDQVRRACDGASRIVVVGGDPQRRTLGDVGSSLRRWGVDLPVGRAGASGAPGEDVSAVDVPAVDVPAEDVPDAALIAWWVLDRACPGPPRSFVGVDGDTAGTAAASSSVEAAGEDVLVVVVADGPASLTPRAPVPEDPRGVALDAELAAWLREGGDLPAGGADTAAEVGWWSRPAWLVLADLVGDRAASWSLSWAPFGVGYHAARWDRVTTEATDGVGT